MTTLDPLCAVCHSTRWCGRPCARAIQQIAPAHPVAKAAKVAKLDAIKPEAPEKPGKQAFDRLAYQREYMRKRRAAAKT